MSGLTNGPGRAVTGPQRGRNKSKGQSAGHVKKKVELLINSINAPGAGFAIIINKSEGGKAEAILQGQMMTIVSALRALCKSEPRFEQMLVMAIAKEPLQTVYDKINNANKHKSDEKDAKK